MGLFKKYVTCTMTFFTPFTFVKPCQFKPITSHVLFIYGIKEKKIFCIYGCFSVSRYAKEVKNYILRHNWVFRHTCMYKQLHWQSSGFIIFLWKYYIVISDTLVDSFLDVFFLLLAVILLELNVKPRRKDFITRKSA